MAKFVLITEYVEVSRSSTVTTGLPATKIWAVEEKVVVEIQPWTIQRLQTR